MLWLHLVSDGIRFGQVNAFMVLACLMDLRRLPGLACRATCRRGAGRARDVDQADTGRLRHPLPREPPVARGSDGDRHGRGRHARAWVLLPEASFTFWGGALQDPARLGPNMGTSNQSLRGFLLRVGPEGMPGTVLWLASVAVVGYPDSASPGRAYLAGDSISEVAAVGLMAVLLAGGWIHHLHWMVVVIFAVLGGEPLRDKRRLVAAAVLSGWFLCRLPWWGISWLNHPEWPEFPGRVLQNADTFGSLLALGLLAWSLSLTIPLRTHGRPAHHARPRGSGARPEHPVGQPRLPTTRRSGSLPAADDAALICSALTAAMTRHTVPPMRRISDRWIFASSAWPSRAASAETVASAEKAPMKTSSGSSYVRTMEAVNSCDRSPHSARNSTTKLVATALRPVAVAAPCARTPPPSRPPPRRRRPRRGG